MKKSLIIYAKNIILLIAIVFILFLIGNFLKPLLELKFDKYKVDKNPNKKVEIVFIVDKNYVKYLRVAIKSAIVNKNKDSIYNISILCVDLSDDDISKIKELKEGNVKINIIPISLDLINDVAPDSKPARITRTNLFKFIIPEILYDIDKVLFLDCDILILKDLSYPYNVDISNKYLASVVEFRKYSKARIPKKIIGSLYYHESYKKDKYWYNAGVLLLNLKKMREDGISKKLIDCKNKSGNNNAHTESTYNKIIPALTVIELPPTCNFIPHLMLTKIMQYSFLCYKTSRDELFKEVVIIHFAGRYGKPDCFKNMFFADLWWKYAKMVGVDE